MKAFFRFVGRLFFTGVVALSLLLHVRFLLGVLLALGVGAWGWRQIGLDKPAAPVPATLQEAIEEASDRVPASLPVPERALRPTLVLPLAGDRELLVTDGIRQALSRHGAYRPVDKGTVQRLLDELFRLAGTPSEPVADRQTAQRIAKASGAEVAMFGRVERFKYRDGQAEVSFLLSVFELDAEQPLLERRFTAPAPEAAAPAQPLRWPLLLGVLAVAGLWPLLTVPVMARVLKLESNLATLLTIVGITAVPAVVAWPVFFGADIGTWRVLLFVVALMFTAIWSAQVMSWVAAREEGG